MAYSKVNWTESTEITAARLNQMETQYDEAVAEGENIRKDNSLEFHAEVVNSLSGKTPTKGRVVYNQGDGRFYYGDNSIWRMAFGRHIFTQAAAPSATLEGDIWLEEID